MFDNLDSGSLIALSLISLLIAFWILHEIIRNAVSSALRKQNETQNQYLKQQTRLISELLKHDGVEEERIIEILDPNKPYFLIKSAQPKS